ncbi:hypothetical protein K458DRAFT_471339 [Lentithecium fluviatile CBS 122367]|uniref:Uncharacterized protein n=1 Tax=Lentithecium fluviatile CBS 122367 TaxID=1168545 RepID=A0A6G1J6Z0_9PLEO|nr:hypothetical protein K458DRAFT_471339 [Lentithecium fluviatile CBS 122367]
MITTIDDNTDGFRLNLIPMALTSSDASSRSLFEATLALSSFHLGNQGEALKHKLQAIKSLSASFQDVNAGRIAQFSGCMILCVYSGFDASDTSRNVHLQGAKTLTQVFSQKDQNSPSLAFLEVWLDYHDTFSMHSYPRKSSKLRLVDIVLPEGNMVNRKIVGLLGCSTELNRLISCINQLHTLTISPPPVRSASKTDYGISGLSHLTHKRLLNLKQEIHIQPGESAGTISHARITLTAEIYRIGALLYLN